MTNNAFAQIVRTLNSPDPQERRQSLEALEMDLVDDALLRIIVQKLEDEHKGVRDAAFQVLKQCKNLNLPKLLAPFFYYRDLEVKNLAVDIMVQIGEEAVPELIQILHTSDPDAQKSAAEVINIIKSHQAVDALLEHLDDPDPNVSFACIEALGTIGDFKAVQPLIEVFKSNEDLRGVAIAAIGDILSRRIPDELLDQLNEEDPLIVFSVIEALGKIKDPVALDKLLEIFPYHDELIQQEILKAVSEIISGSKYILLPEELFQPVNQFYQDVDPEEKSIYLTLFSRIPLVESLRVMFEAYSFSEEEDWQSLVFQNIVTFFILFPNQVDVFMSDCDEEMKYYVYYHMPYSNQKRYFELLSNEYSEAPEGEMKQTFLYYLLSFNLPETKNKIKELISNNNPEEIAVLIEYFKEQPVAEYVTEIAKHISAFPPELQLEMMKIIVEQNIPGFFEKLGDEEENLTENARLMLMDSKESLTEEDVQLLQSVLTGPDEENIVHALKLISGKEVEGLDDFLIPLASKESWQIGMELANAVLRKEEKDLLKFIKTVQDKAGFMEIFFRQVREWQVTFSLPFWEKVLASTGDKYLSNITATLMSFTDENYKQMIDQQISKMGTEEIRALIQEFVEGEQYVTVKFALTQTNIPEEVRNEFEAYLSL
ncbi:MAG: hypothetical protein Kow00108_11080 [Calditrichia bacterium]